MSQPGGITLEWLYSIDEPNEHARRMIEELEAEHARGCTCAVELVALEVLGPERGSILTFVHALDCPRWVSSTS